MNSTRRQRARAQTMTNPDKPNISTAEDHWVVDKKVPLALIASFILTIIVQSALAVWWLSAQAERQEQLAQRVIALEQVRSSERLTALEALLPRIEAQLNRIETKIDNVKRERE